MRDYGKTTYLTLYLYTFILRVIVLSLLIFGSILLSNYIRNKKLLILRMQLNFFEGLTPVKPSLKL